MGQDIVNYDEIWAQQAAAYAQQEQLQGGAFLSTRGGKLMFGEEELPGNQACVIILDAVKENTYYSQAFDPDNAAAPTCYAFGRGPDDSEMSPDPSMQADLSYFVPQHSQCTGCQWNEWGSADKGRGKACQNRRRLAFIPAGSYKPKPKSRDFELELYDSAKDLQAMDLTQIKLPVLSVKNWSKYVNQLAQNFHKPPHAFITRLYLEPDAQAQYKVDFEMIEEVPDHLVRTVMDRHDAAVAAVIQGYKPPQEKPPAHTENPRGSLRGFKR